LYASTVRDADATGISSLPFVVLPDCTPFTVLPALFPVSFVEQAASAQTVTMLSMRIFMLIVPSLMMILLKKIPVRGIRDDESPYCQAQQ
jgi:hypothetical protein